MQSLTAIYLKRRRRRRDGGGAWIAVLRVGLWGLSSGGFRTWGVRPGKNGRLEQVAALIRWKRGKINFPTKPTMHTYLGYVLNEKNGGKKEIVVSFGLWNSSPTSESFVTSWFFSKIYSVLNCGTPWNFMQLRGFLEAQNFPVLPPFSFFCNSISIPVIYFRLIGDIYYFVTQPPSRRQG